MSTHMKSLARGTLLSVILRWFIKGIGLLSTIILARFLTPADYGVMVMATLIIGLVEIFFFTSSDTALLRNQDASTELINSAWTLRLIQALTIAIIVSASTPLAALYFRDDRVIPVMILLSFGVVFGSLSNIGPILARKNLEFGLEVRMGIIAKVISFTVTVIAAYTLRSYWALVIGAYASHIAGVWLSYSMHPYRPKWNTSRIPELWGFSQWLLLSSIGSFFGKKLDELILGRIGTPQNLGIYNLASELGQTITVEISAPVNRSFFPVLSNMQSDRPSSLTLFFYTLGSVNTFTIPAGIGLCMVATPFVHSILGTAWLGVIPILEVFAIQGAIRFLVSPYYVWFMVINKTKFLAVMSWLELGCFLIFAALLYKHGALGLAWARLLTTLVTVVVWIIVGKSYHLSPLSLLRSIIRPLLAGLCMGLAIALVQKFTAIDSYYTLLILLISTGAVVYTLSLGLMWVLMGKPDGLEKSLMNKIWVRT